MANKPYSLRLGNKPTAAGIGFIADITEEAQGWRRSIRAVGGPWLGSFRLVADIQVLSKWFNEYLFNTVTERHGGRVTWKGVIWEMVLTHRGVSRRRTVEDIANAVQAIYTNESGLTTETTVATQAQSVATYGRMEEIILMDNYTQTAAENRRDKVLAERAWPWPRPVGGGGNAETYLDVSVAGMIFTANNKYVTATDSGTGNISTWVSNIITDDLEFFSTGKIQTNTLQVLRALTTPTRAYDELIELTSLGSTALTPWQLYADTKTDGTDIINYHIVDTDPLYFIVRGELRTADGTDKAVAPWDVRPGIARDLEYPVRGQENGSWLNDAADLFLEEVTASDRGLSWSSEEHSEAELLAAQQDYALMLEKMKEDKKGD